MTFDSALSHTIDYGKFIVQLWNYYIVLIIAIFGWLVTLRSKSLSLDFRARVLLIVSYWVVSLVFFFIVEQNLTVIIRLMKLSHELAQIDANSKILIDTYGPTVNVNLIWTLKLTSRLGLPVIAILISLFMWFITEPVPEASASAPGKTES
jgi:hypothetical protein